MRSRREGSMSDRGSWLRNVVIGAIGLAAIAGGTSPAVAGERREPGLTSKRREIASSTGRREVGLAEVLRQAAAASPDVAAARLGAVAAESRIGAAEAAYYPSASLQAVETTGFPGSTGHLGTTGLTGSPYRAGPAAGLTVTIPIWDFGRTSSAVTAAEHEAKSRAEEAEYARYSVYQTVLHIYYRCAMHRELTEAWESVSQNAMLVRDAVHKFVKTGQRSVVERYLSESQLEQAHTQSAVYREKLEEQVKELALLTGMPADAIQCPTLPAADAADSVFHGAGRPNPSIQAAAEDAEAARARLAQARSDYLPKLVGAADLGLLSDVRLVQEKYYALGAALILPVFEGFRTKHQVEEATALVSSAEKRLEARKLAVADLNLRYDKAIAGAKTALVHVRKEYELAAEGFKVAKERFLRLQGSVVDVRAALDNLSRTEIELVTIREKLLEATGAKAILNGMDF